MPLNLEQLADLVNDAARDEHVEARVVGVTPAEGEGCYAEVILDVIDGRSARRMSLGVQRDAPPDEVRRRIARSIGANREQAPS